MGERSTEIQLRFSDYVQGCVDLQRHAFAIVLMDEGFAIQGDDYNASVAFSIVGHVPFTSCSTDNESIAARCPRGWLRHSQLAPPGG